MLKVQNFTKKFGSRVAVDNVSFEIEGGELFSLIGPNGSGKTTIVKSIVGLLRATEGAIQVGGHDVSDEPIAAKSLVGYIPDEPVVWSKVTGEEFLHIMGALYGMDESSRIDKINELLSRFDLAGIGGEYFERFSRGNKQKFSIVGALMHDPELLLIDEPIVGLDPDAAEVAKDMFAGFARDGGAVLMVTHTLPVVEELADRIGVLDKGKLVESGTMSELCETADLDKDADLSDVYSAIT